MQNECFIWIINSYLNLFTSTSIATLSVTGLGDRKITSIILSNVVLFLVYTVLN